MRSRPHLLTPSRSTRVYVFVCVCVPYFYDYAAAVSVGLCRLLGEERKSTAAAAKCISSYPDTPFVRSFFLLFFFLLLCPVRFLLFLFLLPKSQLSFVSELHLRDRGAPDDDDIILHTTRTAPPLK